LTRADRASHTGRRLRIPAGAMPVNTKHQRIAVGPYDRNDGFSPGSDVLLRVPGLDNAAAMARTGAVGLVNMARAFATHQPIVIIDEATGRRQLIWSELDANASRAGTTDLIIHPGKNFTEGHTYIVALRNLRTAAGRLIRAPGWFRALRTGGRLPGAERPQRARYARIFKVLARAGIARSSLYATWDFTVASTPGLTERMLAIRNQAFAQLGDGNLADGQVAGRAPAYQVTSVSTLAPVSGVNGPVSSVQGTFSIPCYLVVCGASAASGFHYSSSKPDAVPTQIPGNVATAPFECIVPSSASPAQPARISLYGHGLLGSNSDVEAANVQAMATEHNMVFCATDWWGLAKGDVLNDAADLANVTHFPTAVDRLEQGVLNTLYLGRLLLHPKGFAADPAFQSAGRPRIDTGQLYYDGNSQGGIMGGMTTAVAPDFTRATLGVTGMNYANLLVQRSVDFAPFGSIIYPSYPDQTLHPLILDLMQQIWDRGDPDGYAQQMTDHPLPDTPAHQVLMQIAYGDHQVSDYAAASEARTVGASAYQPALDLATNRSRDRNLFYGLPAISAFPFRGSAIEVWDSGQGRVGPPPLGNIPPVGSSTNIDPHPDVRATPLARQQKSDFLTPGGAVSDACGGQPCRTSVYAP
ncbi:MAG: hypothetical protein M3010_08975, partial [Candidatus Dormibacteraeota bacterium]|nr:hypothetical protein [Candidatus Dormibacteraeota bacterium]